MKFPDVVEIQIVNRCSAGDFPTSQRLVTLNFLVGSKHYIHFEEGKEGVPPFSLLIGRDTVA